MTRQDERSRAANRDFFTHEHDWYAAGLAGLKTYQLIRAEIDKEIAGVGLLLDVGNGGSFDYDYTLADHVVAVDLFLGDLPPDVFPPNVTPRVGDALLLPEEPDTYDGVLLSMVLHHLTGADPDAVLENAASALDEARRVLKPGGRIIVMESCVPPWFYSVERVGYPLLRRVAGSRAMRHPPTLQLTPEAVKRVMGERFDGVTVRKVPVGPVLLQFGVRWPSALTPARPYCFVGEKPSPGA